MKTAIIGSRNITDLDLSNYVPKSTTEIVSGVAKGIDTLAKNYALANNLPLKEFFPKYKLYGRVAPLKKILKLSNTRI